MAATKYIVRLIRNGKTHGKLGPYATKRNALVDAQELADSAGPGVKVYVEPFTSSASSPRPKRNTRTKKSWRLRRARESWGGSGAWWTAKNDSTGAVVKGRPSDFRDPAWRKRHGIPNYIGVEAGARKRNPAHIGGDAQVQRPKAHKAAPGAPRSIFDVLPEEQRPFGWATPAPTVSGEIPDAWRVGDMGATEAWALDAGADPDVYVDSYGMPTGKLYVSYRDNRPAMRQGKRAKELAATLRARLGAGHGSTHVQKRRAAKVVRFVDDGKGAGHIVISDDLKGRTFARRDHEDWLREHRFMNPELRDNFVQAAALRGLAARAAPVAKRLATQAVCRPEGRAALDKAITAACATKARGNPRRRNTHLTVGQRVKLSAKGLKQGGRLPWFAVERPGSWHGTIREVLEGGYTVRDSWGRSGGQWEYMPDDWLVAADSRTRAFPGTGYKGKTPKRNPSGHPYTDDDAYDVAKAKLVGSQSPSELAQVWYGITDTARAPWLHATREKVQSQTPETQRAWTQAAGAAKALAATAAMRAYEVGETPERVQGYRNAEAQFAHAFTFLRGVRGLGGGSGGGLKPWPMRNPEDRWAQGVEREMEEEGTVGAFTKQARRAGYSDTMAFARAVMAGWRSGRKTVKNKKTGHMQRITTKTMNRANYAINVQPKRNPIATISSGPIPKTNSADYQRLMAYEAAHGGPPPMISWSTSKEGDGFYSFNVGQQIGLATPEKGRHVRYNLLKHGSGYKTRARAKSAALQWVRYFKHHAEKLGVTRDTDLLKAHPELWQRRRNPSFTTSTGEAVSFKTSGRKKKPKRKPSAYNRFVGRKVKELRKKDPELDAKTAFSMAVAAWNRKKGR